MNQQRQRSGRGLLRPGRRERAVDDPCGLCDVPLDRLADMAAAGWQIRECYRLLRKGGGTIVGEVLRGHGAFLDWEHYPPGDVYDDETHSQYYYHAHPGGCGFVEHGHFHTFLRPTGMPAGISPATVEDGARASNGWADNRAPSHLVAISMDETGYPVRLFTTNRWVTGESWYRAEDVIRMLDRFLVDLAYPSLPVRARRGAAGVVGRGRQRWRHPRGSDDRGCLIASHLGGGAGRGRRQGAGEARRALSPRPGDYPALGIGRRAFSAALSVPSSM